MQVNYKYSINSFFTVNLTCEFCSKNARRYLVYGKEFVNQRSTTFDAQYKFSGKERDIETGYGYFGARYYSSELGIWISTDPLADKYPSLTPYAYCANNPIMFIDPDGNRIIAANYQTQRFMKSYFKEQFGSSKMFKFSENGELNINNRQFNRAMRNGNENQRALLSGMKEAISAKETAAVYINKEGGEFNLNTNLSTHDNAIINISGLTTSPDKGSKGNYQIFINDATANSEVYDAGSLPLINNDKIDLKTYGSGSDVFLHETLDEFLNFFIKGSVTDKSSQIDKVNYQNRALENKGQLPRTGSDHQ
jgi:RHS repeat-associated protein